MSPVRVVASVLLAAAALVAGPLAADAAPRPPVTPTAGPALPGILDAVPGLTSVLPPVHVAAGQGPGAVDVTVGTGATVGAGPGAAPVRTATPRTPPATPAHPVHTSARTASAPRAVVRGTHPAAPAPQGLGRTVPAATASSGSQAPYGIAPAVRVTGPLSSPSGAVQQLLRWSLGSDRTMLVILGLTAAAALAALVTVLAMGRRPGLRRAPIR